MEYGARNAPSCSVGTDTERPKLRDKHREDSAELDLEGFGNSVGVFRPQPPADGQLLFWASIGIIRSSREGSWSGWGQPAEGTLSRWGTPCRYFTGFYFFLPDTAGLLVSIPYVSG